MQSRKIYLEQMKEIEINWTALKYFEIRFRLNFYRCYIKALFLEKRPGNRLCLCVMLKFSKNFHNCLTCINNFQINVATDEVSGGNLQFWIKYLEWKKIIQNWKALENFDICFYLIADSYLKIFLIEKETLFPSNSDIFLMFPVSPVSRSDVAQEGW